MLTAYQGAFGSNRKGLMLNKHSPVSDHKIGYSNKHVYGLIFKYVDFKAWEYHLQSEILRGETVYVNFLVTV